MTPKDLNKSLTLLLNELLEDTGFSKQRIGRLQRKSKECAQFFSFSFSRDYGSPGNIYSLIPSMSFSFPLVDQLTSNFMGEKYNSQLATASKPLYLVVPDGASFYKYCAENTLEQFAETLSADFHTYALSFYERYDTLNKLECFFNQHPDNFGLPNGFHVVRANKYGNGRWCCKAAVLCVLEKWDALEIYLDETDLLLPEQKIRIKEYISNV